MRISFQKLVERGWARLPFRALPSDLSSPGELEPSLKKLDAALYIVVTLALVVFGVDLNSHVLSGR